MKLLFDQNLSHRLVQALCEEYHRSQHVREVGLSEASDDAVWQYAARHGFTLITKDADFHQRSFLFGHPITLISSNSPTIRKAHFSLFNEPSNTARWLTTSFSQMTTAAKLP